MDIILTIGLIIVVVFFQFQYFRKSRKKREQIKLIFPEDCDRKIECMKNGSDLKIIDIEDANHNESRSGLSDLYQKKENLELQREKCIKDIEESEKQLRSPKYPFPFECGYEGLEEQIIDLKNKQVELEGALRVVESEIEARFASHLGGNLNPVFGKILSSINNYLSENKSAASDFHLIKDMVERNCEASEEELTTLTPIPLYCGLAGTMLGILLGVLSLVFSGGLKGLTDAAAMSGGEIDGLFSGVAVAMVGSLLGIVLTTINSIMESKAKSVLIERRNGFLNWIQIKILPSLTNDAASVTYQLQHNLNKFNDNFSTNLLSMNDVFKNVSETQKNQLKVIEVVEKLDMKKMANANIEVLSQIQMNTEQFEKFNRYIHKLTEYLEHVQGLSNEINEHLTRTKAIEDMGVFFKEEVTQIDKRKGAISQTVGEIDLILQKTLHQLKDSADEQLKEFVNHSVDFGDKFSKATIEQQDRFMEAINKQDEVLNKRVKEVSNILEEVKNLSSAKSSLDEIKTMTKEQNQKISNIMTIVEKLVLLKSSEQKNVGRVELPGSHSHRMTKFRILIGIPALIAVVLLFKFYPEYWILYVVAILIALSLILNNMYRR